MTSVKNFRIEEPASADSLGRGVFEFTDDYSVFDWGKMPDQIPDKGASLCTMGAFNFELLEENGIPTHYRGVVVDGEVQPLSEAIEAGHAPEEMAISLTTVPELPFEDGSYDYDAYYEDVDTHYLIPLEIVFRNRVPVGSSLRKRSDPADHGLDMDSWPDEPVDLPDAIIEFSTKYEKQDRYLPHEEAESIAGPASIDNLETVAREVNALVTEQAAHADLTHEDGKIECLYHDGEIHVADVVGTFDENRFSRDGQQISKEVIRQYHKRTQPDWVTAVGEAKEEATAAGVADWKARCDVEPEPLDESVIQTARNLYCAGTNEYIGRDIFDAPPLADVLSTVEEL